MRREFIYPHRSVRSFPLSRARLWAAIGTATLLTFAAANFGSSVLTAHTQLSGFILRYTGIPINEVRTVEIFPHLGPVTAPEIYFPHPRANPLRTGLLFAVSVAGLILIHRCVPLSRNFVVFLSVLLSAAGAVIVFNPLFYFDSAMFQQIWLRGEILVWIILSWVAAFLFILTVPSVAGGVAWTLVIEIYAVFWSALRLAFCLGILHYTGILFLPILWFCLGILFDLVYVLVFYSLALNVSMKKVIGERE